MLQNSQITGHTSTERNRRCGTYKEEVAGSNPASPTFERGLGTPILAHSRSPVRRGEGRKVGIYLPVSAEVAVNHSATTHPAHPDGSANPRLSCSGGSPLLPGR